MPDAICLLPALTLALAAATSAGAQQSTSAPGGHYTVTQRFPVGGDGGWDYLAVDTVGHRLFVTRTDRVQVLDQATGKLLGEIPGLHRGHGVAFAYPTGHGFVTSGADSTVTMFDLRTLAVLGTTVAAVDDDAVLYDAASKRVFTMNGDAASATAIDARTGKRIRNIALGGKPEFGVADGRGHVYVNLEDSAQVVELDTRAMRVTRRWTLGSCEEPSGLAIDRVHGLLFSGCGNEVMAVSSIRAGRFVTTVPIGEGVDANAFDASTNTAFSSNGGDGTLTVVHESSPTKFTVVENVSTMTGARTMALDPKTHTVYTVSAQFGEAPAATTDNPRPRRPIVPGSFTVLVLERQK
jgi:DNA-binding beta-propeller fold protein YncE